MRVRVTALVILEALSLAAPTARAAPASGEGPGRAHNVLRWTRTARAEGCVSAEELAAAVESRLNRKVFAGEGQPDLLIEGEVERAARTLSAGERTRAILALLMAQGVNCLVLDEPTNHLDLTAIEQLEQAVAGYDGTLLLVSHDRRLLEAVALGRIVRLEQGQVVADSAV